MERFTIVRSLGTGGMSTILLARDRTGREVVIKRLHPHYTHDDGLVRMFRHEARILDAFEHPALPRVHEFAHDGTSWYMVMEHVPGHSLADLVRAPLPPPFDAGVEVVRQLLEALQHVHTRRAHDGTALRIVHRDVSPGNVMVTRRGQVKLVDFGIATSAWRTDPDRGRLKGTRGYMAPEVITGASVPDARSDLFAVAVILYELTTGTRLYEGPPAQILAAIVDGEVPSPDDVVEGYPPALAGVVRRGLAKDPDARYASASDMIRALLYAVDAYECAAAHERLARCVRALGP